MEGEKKALDELIKLKAEQAKKNVSNGAKSEEGKKVNWKARIALIKDADNKATHDYSLSVHAWSATLSLKADDYSLATLNVQQGACVD